MKVKSLIATLMVLAAGCLGASAQMDRAKQSYNLNRAIEEITEGNVEKAEDFLEKELKDNPKNGYAHLTNSLVQGQEKDYSEALAAANKALEFLPKKDKQSRSIAYGYRGNIYLSIGDTVQALADMGESIRIDPKNETALEARGQLLYELDRYEESDADYQALLKLDPASALAYTGLGRNAHERDNYDQAVKYYEKAINIDEEYSSAYTFRATSCLKQGKYLEAADDIIKALDIDYDEGAFYAMFDFPEDQYVLLITKLRGMAAKKPHDPHWPYYVATLYYDQDKYEEAIEYLDKCFEIDAYPNFLMMKADCYGYLGEYGKAYTTLLEAERIMMFDDRVSPYKADILGDGGDIDGSLEEWSRFIENHPDDGSAYYRRGFFEDIAMMDDEALRDYDMAVMLMPDYVYAWFGKGDVHLRKGETEKAMEAYRKVVELDTVPDENSCAMFALLALDRKDDAVKMMEDIIAKGPKDPETYFNAACFYSRTGDVDKSLAYLKTAFEKGFRKFNQVRIDDDLEALWATEDFQKLMEEYEKPSGLDAVPRKLTEEDEEEEIAAAAPTEHIEVPFVPVHGNYSVKCNINSLPLNFIFDTGASIVSMSQLEANFMLKNGYLDKSDFIGTDHFVDANGDVTENSIINLREVEFAGVKLSNVKASVVKNQKAPLLLGQSVLGRLGSIEIDNAGKKLIIKK